MILGERLFIFLLDLSDLIDRNEKRNVRKCEEERTFQAIKLLYMLVAVFGADR